MVASPRIATAPAASFTGSFRFMWSKVATRSFMRLPATLRTAPHSRESAPSVKTQGREQRPPTLIPRRRANPLDRTDRSPYVCRRAGFGLPRARTASCRGVAPVAELVDAPDSKSGGRKVVLVRFRPGAPVSMTKRALIFVSRAALFTAITQAHAQQTVMFRTPVEQHPLHGDHRSRQAAAGRSVCDIGKIASRPCVHAKRSHAPGCSTLISRWMSSALKPIASACAHAGQHRDVVEFLDRVLEAQPFDDMCRYRCRRRAGRSGRQRPSRAAVRRAPGPRRSGCGAAATARSPRDGRRRRGRAHSPDRSRPA